MNSLQALSTASSIDNKIGLLRGAGSKTGAWVQYGYESGSVKNNGYNGGQYTQNSGVVGAYHGFGNGDGIGVYAETGTDTGFLSGLPDTFTSNQWTLGLYGRVGRPYGFYASGNLGCLHENNQVHRFGVVDGTAQAISSTSIENLLDADINVGYQIPQFDFYANFQNLLFGQPGFGENGGNGFGLLVPGSLADALYVGPGVRYATDFRWLGMPSGISAKLQWDHLVHGRNASSFIAAFEGAPSAGFDVVGQSLPENNLLAEVGLNTRINRTWRFYMSGGASISTSWSVSSMGSAGMRATW